MFVEQYLSKMKTFQDALLAFLRKEDSSISDFSYIFQLLDDLQILKNRGDFKTILHMLLKLSDTFNSSVSIMQKIEETLINLKDDINRYFTNDEIFVIFRNSKKILYFLIKNKMLTVNEFIAKRMDNCDIFWSGSYREFFFPEIRPFISEYETDRISREIPKDYEEKRKMGENDDFVCEIIRNDSIEEFRDLQKSYKITNLNEKVAYSFFETNKILLKHSVTYIEYAAFYGSYLIFNYLLQNKAKINNSLILYAIHGGNQNIIQILQKNKELLKEGNCEKVINESIKCHHNDLAAYFIDRIPLDDDKKFNLVRNFSLKHYNFTFIQKSFINEDSFYRLCKYDYFNLVEFLLKESVIDVNKKEIRKKDCIQNHIVQCNSK